MRPPAALALLALLAVLTGACTTAGVDADEAGEGSDEAAEVVDDEPEPVRIAGGPDAETILLAHVMVELLDHRELPAEVVTFADAADSRRALELGEVDVRPGYTGETWLETLGREPPTGPVESLDEVHGHDQERGIVWLRPRIGEGLDQPPANATFAFVVQGPPGVDADLRTMSQLAARLSEQPDATVCVDQEFGTRPDGLPVVLEAYSVRSTREFLATDPEEAVLGVASGTCTAGLTTTTDGRAWRAGQRPLVDDLRVFPAFVVLPQIRAEAQDERPALRVALGPMATELTTALLGRWNGRVEAGEPVEEVAEDAAALLLARADRPRGEVPAG